jgi:hypothetical protein
MRLTSPDQGGAESWMLWGEIQKSLGRLEAGQIANRQATIDQGAAMRQRQDDMRRELLGHIGLLHRRMGKGGASALGWLRHLPWDRILLGFISLLGTLGLIKPQWLTWWKMLGG